MTITGAGYEPEGQILDEGQPVSLPAGGDLRKLLITGGLCSNARVLPPDTGSTRWTILGDPTEAALKVAVQKAGIDLEQELRITPRVRELPFDSSRKRMSTVHQAPKVRLVYTKGAPREVLGLCTRIWMDGRECALDDALRTQVITANDEYARNGLRVLAVASRSLPGDFTTFIPEMVERDLTFLGLVAMMDPPREEVAEAVERCHKAGIRIIMITGDYGLTAESIAMRIGLVRGPLTRIITGSELDTMGEEALKEALKQEVIFARVAPEQKLRSRHRTPGGGPDRRRHR